VRRRGDRKIERLTATKVAAIIVDVEIRRYGLEDRVTALARKLGLPLVSTFMGRAACWSKLKAQNLARHDRSLRFAYNRLSSPNKLAG
jgi:thiamine pyrophosphate-dependent acetolactate synthase large subunit-like protein